jgi:hypothetical protein
MNERRSQESTGIQTRNDSVGKGRVREDHVGPWQDEAVTFDQAEGPAAFALSSGEEVWRFDGSGRAAATFALTNTSGTTSAVWSDAP